MTNDYDYDNHQQHPRQPQPTTTTTTTTKTTGSTTTTTDDNHDDNPSTPDNTRDYHGSPPGNFGATRTRTRRNLYPRSRVWVRVPVRTGTGASGNAFFDVAAVVTLPPRRRRHCPNASLHLHHVAVTARPGVIVVTPSPSPLGLVLLSLPHRHHCPGHLICRDPLVAVVVASSLLPSLHRLI
ncbi:hypothetical protein EDB85DRAFT_1898141 [Lactarius pseudohatsudake]|nr:hypothetical protein EDB85DRAFT_1898141 [Lactarius pseudohatsudake]